MNGNEIKYSWQHAVVDAFLAGAQELGSKISIAERAILARLKESHSLEMDEKIALGDALRALQVLISEVQAHREELPMQRERGVKRDMADTEPVAPYRSPSSTKSGRDDPGRDNSRTKAAG